MCPNSRSTTFRHIPVPTMKRVSFTTDTRFDVGRSFKEYHRSRVSRHYNPGTFSGLGSHGLHDTSFLVNPFFDCLQLKVFTGSQDEVDDLLDTFEAPTRNECIVAHHQYREAILKLLEDVYGDDEEALLLDLRGTDWVLLSSEGGSLVDVALHETWDMEDMEWLDGESLGTPDQAAVQDTQGLVVNSAQSIVLYPPDQHRGTPSLQAYLQTQGSKSSLQDQTKDGSVAAPQSDMSVLKSCLKKRSAEDDITPSAPKRTRFDQLARAEDTAERL
ncbi:hypothetical protein DE146DRAFT_632180 [Phaeosphaeria sp. MPI-PUGE-AT-0046c]|nr:hypothetical protein DE146DRAFT_632180 [Phaeosphaeria sp. MPI-PUGE-AT-0046c]